MYALSPYGGAGSALSFVAGAALFLSVLTGQSASASVSVDDESPQRILIVDEAVADLDDVEEIVAGLGDGVQPFGKLGVIVAELDDSAATNVGELPGVDVVEDTRVSTQSTFSQPNAPWNLSRLDQSAPSSDRQYRYGPAAGAGVRVYIVDTGVTPNAQFGTRLLSGADFVRDGRGTADCNGHGTHVAGIVGSSAWGVAKQSLIVPVRAMDCNGEAWASDVIASLDWIIANHPSGTPGVVNMSLGGPYNFALNVAVIRASFAGLVTTVAAGNEGDVACNYSPASSSGAITVGATDSTDWSPSWSNYGFCVDIFAPGVAVDSLRNNGSSTPVRAEGTSVAAPHVAGIAALVWSSNVNLTAVSVESEVLNRHALVGVVGNPGFGSANKLATSIPPATMSSTATLNGTAPIYRFWSHVSNAHFYTQNTFERDMIITSFPTSMWRYEGVAYQAYPSMRPGLTPLYRFWNDTSKSHFYTTNSVERDLIITRYPNSAWRYEGEAFYVLPPGPSDASSQAVSRFYSQSGGTHFFTANDGEAASIRANFPVNVWRFEGSAFRVPR